jgi:hypothetical protein
MLLAAPALRLELRWLLIVRELPRHGPRCAITASLLRFAAFVLEETASGFQLICLAQALERARPALLTLFIHLASIP